MINTTREQILQEMGLGPVWKLRLPAAERSPPLVTKEQDAIIPDAAMEAPFVGANDVLEPYSMDESLLDWKQLAKAVIACKQCPLCEQRKQAVLGVGDLQADWLFVGEGPGAEEDVAGEPFVGQAGKLLDNMLAAIRLQRGADVYIANAVKCRPPGNRTPTEDELVACRLHLVKQIELIRPRLIVALGSSAAKALLQRTDVKVGALRGQMLQALGIPLIVTYHPSYLLRSPMEKAKAWEDLCFMRRTMHSLKAQTAVRSDS